MDPPPCFFIWGATDWTDRNILLTLTSNTRWNSSVVTSSVGYEAKLSINKRYAGSVEQAGSTLTLFLYVVPALLTQMSMWPHWLMHKSIALFQSISFVTSIFIARLPGNSDAFAFAPGSSISPIKIAQPSWAKRAAIAAPNPEAPPTFEFSKSRTYRITNVSMLELTCYKRNFTLQPGSRHHVFSVIMNIKRENIGWQSSSVLQSLIRYPTAGISRPRNFIYNSEYHY